MKISKKQRIVADESFDKYEDEIKEIGQEFTSENTSINSSKLPAIFRLVNFEPGTTNLDFGGGKFDNAADYLSQYDVINLVYDPYNRSAAHNAEVIRLIREAGGADTATCSNVLNVIKEPEVRNNVLQNIKKLVKPGGEVYITVYEGTGDGDEGPTKAGYQLNRKTADYVDEIREVFPDAQRRGKLIVAHNASSIRSSRIVIECNQSSKIFIEAPTFTTAWHRLGLSDDVLSELENDIIQDPDNVGDLIVGTHGARKIRLKVERRSKSRSGRVIYVSFVNTDRVYLMTVYMKKDKTTLSEEDKSVLRHLVDAFKAEERKNIR